MKTLILVVLLCAKLASARADNYLPPLTDKVLPLAAYANLRHDVFGNNYTNIYGTADLYANLNSVNDDRAVLEFPIYQIPAGSTISSATLTIDVWCGGGNTGNVGTFRLYGYSGDGIASLADYYDQEVLLKTSRKVFRQLMDIRASMLPRLSRAKTTADRSTAVFFFKRFLKMF